MGCHFLLQGIFLSQGLNLHLLYWPGYSLPLSHQGSPIYMMPEAPPNAKRKEVFCLCFSCLSMFHWSIQQKSIDIGLPTHRLQESLSWDTENRVEMIQRASRTRTNKLEKKILILYQQFLWSNMMEQIIQIHGIFCIRTCKDIQYASNIHKEA